MTAVETIAVIQRVCPVCDASGRRALFDNPMAVIDDFDFSYGVVACDACGMVYASQTLPEAAWGRYYQELSKYDFPAVPSEIAVTDLHRARLASDFTRSLVSSHARIVDVGCSIGLFLSELVRAGYADVHGLEPSDGAATRARTLFGLDVQVGQAAAFDDYETFDVIALLAVLEHLVQPREIFDLIAGRMKDGALLIVEIPDADAFGAYERPGISTEPFGEFSIEHINFFGDGALQRLGAGVGLARVAATPMDYGNGCAGLLMAFRKGKPVGLHVDTALTARSVERYVARGREAMDRVDALLATALEASPTVALYGAGSHSVRLLAQSVLRPESIGVVLDRNANLIGRSLAGIPITAPVTLGGYPTLPLVVSTFNARTQVVEFVTRSFKNPVISLYPTVLPAALSA